MANALSSHLRGLDESSRNLQNQSAPPHSGTTQLTGSINWTPGPPIGHEPPEATLLLALASPIPASQMFMSAGPETIDVDLNGAASGAAIGSGPQQELLAVSDSSDGGTLRRTALDGTVVYTHGPRAVDLADDARGLCRPRL
jgi:hypothetical protein